MSPAIVSDAPSCVCIMYDSVFSHSSPVVTEHRRHVEHASQMMHARLKRPEDVGGGRERAFGALPLSLGIALMYPLARRQYAIHSAVIQSPALACQMVSPTLVAGTQFGKESLESWEDL